MPEIPVAEIVTRMKLLRDGDNESFKKIIIPRNENLWAYEMNLENRAHK